MPSNDFFKKYVNVGAFDLVSFRFVDQLFVCEALPTYKTGGEGNYGKVSSAEIDALLDQAATEPDAGKSIELYNQADRLIWKAGHSFELFQTPQINAVRPGLANFGAFGLRSSRQYVDVGWVK